MNNQYILTKMSYLLSSEGESKENVLTNYIIGLYIG